VLNKFTEEQRESLWDEAQSDGLSRRHFLKMLLTGGAAVMLADCAGWSPEPIGLPKAITYGKLPRWRGFNLVEKAGLPSNNTYLEWDFDTMVEWGFDFVRLPTDYRIWTESPGVYRDQPLKEIDQAIAWARERGIHVDLCLHRVPGYCVNPPKEPLDLWSDGPMGEEARRQFAAQWQMLAARYRGIPPAELSFNLVNEPPNVPAKKYVRAVTPAVTAIRGEDPDRLIIADGVNLGGYPVKELLPLKIAQSTRGYDPMSLTHYRAPWVPDSESWPTPTWPIQGNPLLVSQGRGYNKKTLWRKLQGWKELADRSVGVHVGEWGAYRYTPHNVVLAWMKDCLDNWKQAGIGWALWNLRGPFGPLDSNRGDVTYENYKGHKLDREMLELLKQG
jgi:endoglucanase